MIVDFAPIQGSQSNARQALGNGQHNLLILLVDQLTAPHPSLEGIWLLITIPETPRVTLVPVFPSAKETTDLPLYIESFTLTDDHHPDPGFLALLGEQILWNDYLVADREAIARIINYFEIQPEPGDAFGAADNAWLEYDQALSLQQQTQLWQFTCSALSTTLPGDTSASLLNLFNSNLLTTFSWEKSPFLTPGEPVNGSKLVCEFPTLNLVSP